MNFAKGILESRKQHYKKLRSVLRPIPLNTPTNIEIGLGRFIRVTLFDANHCAGAVMFLIEDEQTAVLYTGDIRSEIWWVNNLARNPAMLLYSSGIRRLDNMYLDTTFATKSDRFRSFPPKAAGIKELLEQILKFPEETVFHFNAWTLGYEDVWIAISSALNTPVHVDDYKLRLYGSLASDKSSLFQYPEGPSLVGFTNGNHFQRGCLTDDRSVRFHSCEHGTGCPASNSSKTVYITPIINKDKTGEILPESGAGNGGADLIHNHPLLELNDSRSIELLLEMCNEKVKDFALRSKIREMIDRAADTNEQTMFLANVTLQDSEGHIEMGELVDALIDLARSRQRDDSACTNKNNTNDTMRTNEGPRRINFAYSRHSSYEELCKLVSTFRPRDIYPCTTDWLEWSWASSIENLFGHLSDMVLAHDQEMESLETHRARMESKKRLRSPSNSPGQMSFEGDNEQSSQRLPHAFKRNFSHGLRASSVPNGQSFHADKNQMAAELRRAFENRFESIEGDAKPQISTCSNGRTAGRTDVMLNNNLNSLSQGEDRHVQELLSCQSCDQGEHLDGAQAEAMKFSDDELTDSNSQAQEAKKRPPFQNVVISEAKEDGKEGSQITLSDSYFDSQLVDMLSEEHTSKVQHRKQAYKATQTLNSAWDQEHMLVSSGADHGELETEL